MVTLEIGKEREYLEMFTKANQVGGIWQPDLGIGTTIATAPIIAFDATPRIFCRLFRQLRRRSAGNSDLGQDWAQASSWLQAMTIPTHQPAAMLALLRPHWCTYPSMFPVIFSRPGNKSSKSLIIKPDAIFTSDDLLSFNYEGGPSRELDIKGSEDLKIIDTMAPTLWRTLSHSWQYQATTEERMCSSICKDFSQRMLQLMTLAYKI